MQEDLLPENKNLIPYATSTLDPVIKETDLTEFKNKSIRSVKTNITLKMQALKEEYDTLVDLFNINKMVLESKIGFEPVKGTVYHLYQRHEESFLSLIDPDEWTDESIVYVVSVTLDADNVWQKIEI